MKKQNGNESLLALVLSGKRLEFRAILEKFESHLKGMDNNKNPEKRTSSARWSIPERAPRGLN